MAAAFVTIPLAFVILSVVLCIADNLGGGRWY